MLHTKWATHVILDTEIMNKGDNFWQYKIFKLQQNSVLTISLTKTPEAHLVI